MAPECLESSASGTQTKLPPGPRGLGADGRGAGGAVNASSLCAVPACSVCAGAGLPPAVAAGPGFAAAVAASSSAVAALVRAGPKWAAVATAAAVATFAAAATAAAATTTAAMAVCRPTSLLLLLRRQQRAADPGLNVNWRTRRLQQQRSRASPQCKLDQLQAAQLVTPRLQQLRSSKELQLLT